MRLIDADELMRIIIHRSYSVTDYWNNRDAGMFLCGIEQAVNELPVVDAEHVIRCKDCKHFLENYWAVVDGVPLIVAHEICDFWGGGSKTAEDGWCFMAERKEE